MDTFDLTQTPDRISAQWGFIFLFLAIGIGLLVAAWIALRLTTAGRSGAGGRLRHLTWFMIPLGLLWTGFTLWMGSGDIRSARAARENVLQGDYQTLEGCLDYFRPGAANPGKTVAGHERWAVRGHAFSYGSGEARFAYHKVEPLDGIVHRHSRVRVSFIPDEFLGRDGIVRLEVTQNACPDAPDAPSLD